ncbi:MAG: tyrosine phenol-lyase [Thermoleophilia bacterium]|nr:tyrosine phenol-lyase [Thermoleophilia bacterium]
MSRLLPPPWKTKVVEPIELRSASERRIAIGEAGYNTFLLRSEDVFVDLLTDSGTSALSQEQRAAMELGDEAYAGSRSFFRLEQVARETFGYRYLIPAHQGRGAEHLLALALVRPGTIVPSNLYFTTSREHVELAGGRWVDVAVEEATDPESPFAFKGNIDLARLAEMENLAAVRALTREHGVPFILDATRISENALFVKEREPGYEERSLRELIRLIADHADGAIFSSKKDHFVPIGGFVAVNDLELARRIREQVVVYEGFPHYGGMAGHDMEALAQGIRESTDDRVVGAYVSQARYLGTLLADADVPIVVPIGAHAVFVDAKRLLPHLDQTEFPAQTLAAAFYLAGGVRSMERGIVSGQHGSDPYDGLELVRLTLPRRVYTQEHLTWVADVVKHVQSRAEEIPGLRITYEPEHLRFFQARFAPLEVFPDLAIENA